MKYLILTDIHGNSDALDAVLDEGLDGSIDSVLVLGDLVGYGAGPNEVIDTLLGLAQPTVVIRGNHDKVVASAVGDAHFNSVAREAVRWTSRELTRANSEYLARLPRGPIEVEDGVFVCHGSPLDEDQYVVDLDDAASVFAQYPGRLAFFGHTHLPTCFSATRDAVSSLALEGADMSFDLEPGTRYLLNPGSVGQPRDRDPRAAFFVYDSSENTIRWRRCDYRVQAAQRRIVEAGLPEVLAHRLAVGI